MANLGYTNAQWLRFFREAGLWLRQLRWLEEGRRRFSRERIQVINENDATSATPHFTSVVLTGIHYGTNTTEDGLLHVRFVANGGNWDVHLYKATGGAGGNEVARATNVAASATGTLTAQNSSGVGGTVTLGATIAGETNDRHRLRINVDPKVESLQIFPSDGTTDDDTDSRTAFEAFLDDMTGTFDAAQRTWRSRFSEWARNRGGAFLETGRTDLWTETPNVDASTGAVTRTLTGILQVLSRAMEDEGTGSEQDVVRRLVAAAATVFNANNTGSGTFATPTPENRCPIGRWRFECVRGLGNGFGGREEFQLTFRGTDDNDDVSFTDGAPLRIKQSFTFPRGGGSSTLLRTLTKTGDGSNLHLGAVSTFTVTNETENNTASGVLYWRVNANGSNWDIQFYKGSASSATNQTAGDLVAQATNVATAATGVTAAARNNGPTIVFNVGSAPVATTTGTIDLNYFSNENGAGEPDSFDVVTSLTSEGVWSRILALEILQAEINTDTSGSEQISELIMEAGVGLNYVVDDV